MKKKFHGPFWKGKSFILSTKNMGTCFRFNQSEKHQYTDLHLFQSSYYPFFGSCCKETDQFRLNICFKTREHSVQTAGDNSKVISQAFRLTLVLYIFKLVLHFSSSIARNQITYHLARNGGNFLQIQSCFATFDYESLLLKEHLPKN